MANKSKAKKTAHKSTAVKRHNHLLKDHPHFWWLILVFLGLTMFLIWKYQQNQLKIEAIMGQPVYFEMDITEMPASPSAAY